MSRGFSARDTSAVHGAPGELCQQSLNALDGLSAGAPGETATHYTLPGSALAFGVSGDAWGGAVLRGSPGLVSRLHAAACTCQVALWPPTCLDGPAALWEQEDGHTSGGQPASVLDADAQQWRSVVADWAAGSGMPRMSHSEKQHPCYF